MTAKDKAALMRRLRAQRERDGMVQLNVWVKREHVARVRKYVARLANNGEGSR